MTQKKEISVVSAEGVYPAKLLCKVENISNIVDFDQMQVEKEKIYLICLDEDYMISIWVLQYHSLNNSSNAADNKSLKSNLVQSFKVPKIPRNISDCKLFTYGKKGMFILGYLNKDSQSLDFKVFSMEYSLVQVYQLSNFSFEIGSGVENVKIEFEEGYILVIIGGQKLAVFRILDGLKIDILSAGSYDLGLSVNQVKYNCCGNGDIWSLESNGIVKKYQ